MQAGLFNTPVTVLFLYDGDKRYACPVRLFWRGREFELGAVQFWHTTHHNGRLTHHYTLSDVRRTFVFRLALETDDLTWTLEEYRELGERPGLRRFQAQPRLVGALG